MVSTNKARASSCACACAVEHHVMGFVTSKPISKGRSPSSSAYACPHTHSRLLARMLRHRSEVAMCMHMRARMHAHPPPPAPPPPAPTHLAAPCARSASSCCSSAPQRADSSATRAAPATAAATLAASGCPAITPDPAWLRPEASLPAAAAAAAAPGCGAADS